MCGIILLTGCDPQRGGAVLMNGSNEFERQWWKAGSRPVFGGQCHVAVAMLERDEGIDEGIKIGASPQALPG